MPSLPVVSGKQVVRALAKIGFRKASQKGSHVKLRHADGRTVIVPMHAELREGTLRSILRQAQISVEEFLALLD